MSPPRADDDLQEMDVHDDDGEASPVEIPTDELSADALRGVVESYVNREGTDYGTVERSFESKVADVMRQLERGEAKVVFDPGTESVTLVVVR
jgi:uncharacterized protein YheU (UPF0270 family)